jgi:O-antigen/teichoic acid export membrane protein
MGLANEVLMMWWLPKRFNLHHRPRRYGFYVSLGMTYILLVGSALLFICPVLMRLITPEEYHAAADFIPLIIACFVVFGLTTLSNSGAYGDKNTFIPLIINTLAAILVIVLYTYLIPLYSVMGAIWATLIAHLFRLVAYYAVRVKKHKIRLRPLAIIPSLVLFLAILINQLFPVL